MEEQLLHFLWHRKLFSNHSLLSTEGEEIDILHPGTPNQDQGPDFLQARIRIGTHLWAGHVEIHVRSSAWYMHHHDHDPHYQNVILHVVWKEDQPVYTGDRLRLPCLELEGRVDPGLLQRYHHLMNNEEWVPCATTLLQVPGLIRSSWLERMMAERLESKTTRLTDLLDRTGQHWEQAFFALLARQLGAPSNGETMESLCTRIPWNILRKHGDRIDQLEAILFGCAGMLTNAIRDPYVLHLKTEYLFLRRKYDLAAMPGLHWKFMRMRPMHFPTLRIAQLARIIHEVPLFVALLEKKESAEVWINRFRVQPHAEFWETHYHFTSPSPRSTKQLGRSTAASLVINVVAPVTFLYGKVQGQPGMKAHALELLSTLPPEENAITSSWKTHGWPAGDAGQSQGLLHLKKNYCDARRCMHCAVGLQVLR